MRQTPPLLAVCSMIALSLCGAQFLGNHLLILLCCGAFLLLMIGAACKETVFPLLLFFLPWATLLKLSPDGKSFYSIALILVCGILFLKRNLSLNALCLLSAIAIFALSISSKLLDGEGISFSYLMFLLMLVLFPNMAAEHSSFPVQTVFFTFGILLSALTAKFFADTGNISAYITVHSGEGLLRYSGYYGDANFYSAHISAAIAALLLMVLQEKNLNSCLRCALLILPLLYCGFLAASKAFLLTLMAVFVLWLLLILWKKPLLIRIAVLAATTATALFILSSGWMETLLFRLKIVSSFSELTTGRTELWLDYLRSLLEEPKLFLLGVGLSESKLHGFSAHNTILQSLYQLGLLGVFPLFTWLCTYLHSALPKKWFRIFPQAVMLGIGCFLPWMALDLLFFDEFFLLPLFWAAGCNYTLKGESNNGTNPSNRSAGTAEHPI